MTALMDQGEQALFAKDYKNARDAFSDILTADPRNQMALEGATLAYLELGDYTHAKTDLEKGLALSAHPSRWSAINGAAIYVHTKTPMRSVRLLIQYMTPLKAVDEQALNALAVALNETDDQARKGRLYSEAVNFYAAQTKKLEEQNPDMKRWGTQWLPADEADSKNAAWNANSAAAAKLGRELAALKAHLAVVERNQNDPTFAHDAAVQNYFRGSANRPVVTPMDELTLSRLQPEVDAAQAAYDKLIQTAERPPLPDAIEPVNIYSQAAPSLATAPKPAPTIAPAAVPQLGNEPPALAGTPASPATAPTQVAIAKPQPVVPPIASPKTTVSPQPTDPNSVASVPADAAAPKKTYRVTSYAAAFAVGANLLVTSAESVADASDIQIQAADGTAFPATVVRSDAQSGLALLRVPAAKFNWLNLADQFGGGSISCVSFPGVDLFQPAATSIAGSAMSPKEPWRVRLSETPRLGGGPLLVSGKVVGVELATRDSELGAIPAVTLDALKKFLASDLSSTGTAADGVSATVQLTATRDK